jgi:hypothetical protein
VEAVEPVCPSGVAVAIGVDTWTCGRDGVVTGSDGSLGVDVDGAFKGTVGVGAGIGVDGTFTGSGGIVTGTGVGVT